MGNGMVILIAHEFHQQGFNAEVVGDHGRDLFEYADLEEVLFPEIYFFIDERKTEWRHKYINELSPCGWRIMYESANAVRVVQGSSQRYFLRWRIFLHKFFALK